MSKKKVVVAMSGGVDSSVTAALLLREGYDVVGITMRLWTEERDDLPETNRTCCGVEAVDDAQRVAQLLDFPYYVMNFERPFKERVVDYFVQEYRQGRTPNPCLNCNQYVKFDNLLAKARALGADYLATGHYARVQAASEGSYHLLKGIDPAKDQSYFLYTLGQDALRQTLMPVGHYTKDEIRAIARELDLPVAGKPDSQEICFIPDNDYRRFVRERVAPDPGAITDAGGQALGLHQGVANYTVGQRHGLGIATPDRMYVTGIDATANRVIVGPEQDLYGSRALLEDVHFTQTQPAFPLEVEAKIRYKSAVAPARVSPGDGGMLVEFATPQRALTPGQAVVFYRDDEVIGGGRLVRALPAG